MKFIYIISICGVYTISGCNKGSYSYSFDLKKAIRTSSVCNDDRVIEFADNWKRCNCSDSYEFNSYVVGASQYLSSCLIGRSVKEATKILGKKYMRGRKRLVYKIHSKCTCKPQISQGYLILTTSQDTIVKISWGGLYNQNGHITSPELERWLIEEYEDLK